MTALLSRRRTLSLEDRLEALREAVDVADGRLDPDEVAAARAVAARASERLGLGPESTVVALAGATGSGKSSLFNALAGSDLSTVGVRRPTTSAASACVWGDGSAGDASAGDASAGDASAGDASAGDADAGNGADRLLGWLQVPSRHRVGRDPELDGLVLLDLPDHDSTRVSHRLEVDRLVGLVDLLVWVLDPQKYADAAVHDRYLRPLAGHAGVMVVVLNQVDRLPGAARGECLAHLRGLLDAEGLRAAPLVATSVRTGDGVPELRKLLAERVSARRAAAERLAADVVRAGGPLRRGCDGGGPGSVRPSDRTALVAALSDAAAVDTVTRAVAGSHRARSVAATGWPFTRWVRRLRPDPLRRLHLGTGAGGTGAGGTGAGGTGAGGTGAREAPRTSLPGPSAVQRARVATAVRGIAQASTRELADPWPTLVRRVAGDSERDLPDLLDRAVAGTDLGVDRRPRWWALAGLLQVLLAGAAVVGLLWLVALFAVSYLRLPEPPTYEVRGIALPTVLLLGGLLAGILLAAVCRQAARVGAARRARTARRRLTGRVEAVAVSAVLAPVEAELAARARMCAALERATQSGEHVRR